MMMKRVEVLQRAHEMAYERLGAAAVETLDAASEFADAKAKRDTGDPRHLPGFIAAFAALSQASAAYRRAERRMQLIGRALAREQEKERAAVAALVRPATLQMLDWYGQMLVEVGPQRKAPAPDLADLDPMVSP